MCRKSGWLLILIGALLLLGIAMALTPEHRSELALDRILRERDDSMVVVIRCADSEPLKLNADTRRLLFAAISPCNRQKHLGGYDTAGVGTIECFSEKNTIVIEMLYGNVFKYRDYFFTCQIPEKLFPKEHIARQKSFRAGETH